MSGNSCKINQMGLLTTKRERTAKINLRKYFYKLDKNVTYRMNKSTLVISIAEKTLTQPVPTSAFWGLQGQSQLQLVGLSRKGPTSRGCQVCSSTTKISFLGVD